MTSKADKMGLRYSPMAFTEQGVAMLSSVLEQRKSDPGEHPDHESIYPAEGNACRTRRFEAKD